MARTSRKDNGISLAKGPVGLLGLAMIAWGVIHFLVGGGTSFTADPMSGTVDGDTFLGLEGNGWTNVLWVGAGLLLAFGAPMHWGAKSMALIIGLVLGAASIISIVDGNDVFGIFATNGPTQLALGAAAVVLIVLSLLPRVGKDKDRGTRDEHLDDERRVTRRRTDDRDERFTREPAERRERVAHGERDHGHERESRVVAPADGDGVEDRGRHDRRL